MLDAVLGTHNPAKLAELLRILGDIPGLNWLDFRVVDFPEPDESGATFEANAAHKALEICRYTGLPTLAEDSGLEVEALDGAPGVLSARYAGPDKDVAANNVRLLRMLEGTANRKARFRTVAVLRHPDGRTWYGEGVLHGTIAVEPRGKKGFGYDPLFVPLGAARTLAEMCADEKDVISHRRRALEALRPALIELGRTAVR